MCWGPRGLQKFTVESLKYHPRWSTVEKILTIITIIIIIWVCTERSELCSLVNESSGASDLKYYRRYFCANFITVFIYILNLIIYMKRPPMTQRNVDDCVWKNTNDKIKMIKMLKLRSLRFYLIDIISNHYCRGMLL